MEQQQDYANTVQTHYSNMQAVLHYNLSTLKNFPVVQLLQYSAIV